MLTILVVFIFILIIWYNIFLSHLNKKVLKLEKIIILHLEKRSHLIPALYEITLPYLSKHQEVFEEILYLRKQEFFNSKESFLAKVWIEKLIHHELNFIFQVANKHPKIQKDEKFLLIRDLFLDNSLEIWKKIKLYKKVILYFNKMLRFKNYTFIWVFHFIDKRIEI